MSENNVNGITGADVATTTGIIGATIGIGQYIVNDYVITIAEIEGDYGYTMTITRGTETQTVTLYGLTAEQYDAMLGYLEAAQTAAQSARESAQAANQSARSAGIDASSAASAKNSASNSANRAASNANNAVSAKNDAVTAKNAAEAAATRADAAADAMSTATATDVGKALSPKTVADGKVTEWQFITAGGGGGGAVDDVQVDGVSVVTDGVANIPAATSSTLGVVSADASNGVAASNGALFISPPTSEQIKTGAYTRKPIVVSGQHEAAFYGLAKAAGDTTQPASANAVGNYTESAKSAISEMLNGSIAVTGTTPSITALPGVRYVCGEVSTIDITVPATGIIDVMFTSGSTPAVLTVTPPIGVTMKWVNDFDPTSLDANTVYEINIMDGSLGVAGTWT